MMLSEIIYDYNCFRWSGWLSAWWRSLFRSASLFCLSGI